MDYAGELIGEGTRCVADAVRRGRSQRRNRLEYVPAPSQSETMRRRCVGSAYLWTVLTCSLNRMLEDFK